MYQFLKQSSKANNTWKARSGAEEMAPLIRGTDTSATYTCAMTMMMPVHTPDVAWNKNTIHTC